MTEEKTVRGTNFTCYHAGPMAGWTEYRLGPPDVPLPARGKLFLRGLLGSAGLEMSLNVVPPGKAMPFLHRHRENDEVYVVVGGRGQFLVDGECIDAQRMRGATLRVHSRMGGERMQAAANRPRRALKSILQDAGVPPWQRASLPVVTSGSEVVAVPGIAVDASWQAPKGARGIVLTFVPRA